MRSAIPPTQMRQLAAITATIVMPVQARAFASPSKISLKKDEWSKRTESKVSKYLQILKVQALLRIYESAGRVLAPFSTQCFCL